MNRAELILAFLLSGTLSLFAQETKKEAEPLQFRVMRLPACLFSTVDTAERNGNRKPRPGVRALSDAPERQYDVAELLSDYGVSFPPGGVAVYIEESSTLLLRNTATNLDIATKVFSGAEDVMKFNIYSVEVSAYECTPTPVGMVLPWEKLTYSDLQKLPRDSVKLIDRISLTGGYGRPLTASHVTAPAPPDYTLSGTGLFQPDETGSQMETESTDGEINLTYLLRARLGEHDSAIAKVNFSTVFRVWDEYPLIIHAEQSPGRPGKFIVVVARVNGESLAGWKLPDPKPDAGSNAASSQIPAGMRFSLIRTPPGFFRAGAGSDNLLTNPPGSASAGDAPQRKPDPEEFFRGAGVDFPKGSMACYDPQSSILISLNTPQNLDLIDRIVDADLGTSELILVELSAVEFSFPATMVSHNADTFHFADLEQLPVANVKQLSFVSFVAMTGKTAKFHNGEAGVNFEAMPSFAILPPSAQVAGADMIDLDLMGTLQMPAKKEGGEISRIKIAEHSAVKKDEPAILRILPEEDHEGKYIAIVARARWINFGGWTLPK